MRESLVLLKNDPWALPLSKTARRIHVAGRNADDLGNQCGGWTITWQGKSGAPTTGTGKLSFSWPRSMAQVPINVGDAKYDPLFPFGFGPTY